jgi:hypothetical protein
MLFLEHKYNPELDKEYQAEKEYEKDNEEQVERVEFPQINENLSLEQLAKIYRAIEDKKDVKSPINIPGNYNVIPSSRKGDCRDTLVGIVIDKRDFEKRMPKILAHHIRCHHKKVILVVGYWDGSVWETTWNIPFEEVGGEVFRQMYDGLPERII